MARSIPVLSCGLLLVAQAAHGHQGALWTVDVNPDSTLLATGGADNTMRLWEVKTRDHQKI